MVSFAQVDLRLWEAASSLSEPVQRDDRTQATSPWGSVRAVEDGLRRLDEHAGDDPFDDFDDDDFDDEFDDDFEEDWEDDLTEDEEFPDTFGGDDDEGDDRTADVEEDSPFSDDPDFDED